MRVKRLHVSFSSMAVIAVAGCSSIVQGTSEEVAVETPGGSGARCLLTGGDDVNASVTSPGKVKVPKSKHDIKVTCTTPNGQVASRVFASSYSNYSYVQLPVGYAVDASLGAMWVYPTVLTVPFTADVPDRRPGQPGKP